jgi:hypothetical protein
MWAELVWPVSRPVREVASGVREGTEPFSQASHRSVVHTLPHRMCVQYSRTRFAPAYYIQLQDHTHAAGAGQISEPVMTCWDSENGLSPHLPTSRI